MNDNNGRNNSSRGPEGNNNFSGGEDDATQVFHRSSQGDSASANPNGPKPPEYHRAEEYDRYGNDGYGNNGYGNAGYQQDPYNQGYGQGYGQGYDQGYGQGGNNQGYDQGYGQGGYGQGYDQGGYNQDYGQGGYDQGYGQGGYGPQGGDYGPPPNNAYQNNPQQPGKSHGQLVGILAVVLPILLLLAIGFGIFMFINSGDDQSGDEQSSSSTTSETSETTTTTETTESDSPFPSELPSFPTEIPEFTGPDLSTEELFPSDFQQRMDDLRSQLESGLNAPDQP